MEHAKANFVNDIQGQIIDKLVQANHREAKWRLSAIDIEQGLQMFVEKPKKNPDHQLLGCEIM